MSRVAGTWLQCVPETGTRFYLILCPPRSFSEQGIHSGERLDRQITNSADMDAGIATTRLHVSGLTANVTPAHIRDRFASFGTVRDVEELQATALGESWMPISTLLVCLTSSYLPSLDGTNQC